MQRPVSSWSTRSLPQDGHAIFAACSSIRRQHRQPRRLGPSLASRTGGQTLLPKVNGARKLSRPLIALPGTTRPKPLAPNPPQRVVAGDFDLPVPKRFPDIAVNHDLATAARHPRPVLRLRPHRQDRLADLLTQARMSPALPQPAVISTADHPIRSAPGLPALQRPHPDMRRTQQQLGLRRPQLRQFGSLRRATSSHRRAVRVVLRPRLTRPRPQGVTTAETALHLHQMLQALFHQRPLLRLHTAPRRLLTPPVGAQRRRTRRRTALRMIDQEPQAHRQTRTISRHKLHPAQLRFLTLNAPLHTVQDKARTRGEIQRNRVHDAPPATTTEPSVSGCDRSIPSFRCHSRCNRLQPRTMPLITPPGKPPHRPPAHHRSVCQVPHRVRHLVLGVPPRRRPPVGPPIPQVEALMSRLHREGNQQVVPRTPVRPQRTSGVRARLFPAVTNITVLQITHAPRQARPSPARSRSSKLTTTCL